MFLLIPKKIKSKLIKHEPVYILINWLILLVLLFIGFVLCFKLTEKATINESVWQAWQTFTTVGYGNKPADTLNGRLVTIFFSTIGIAVLGAIFSCVFDLRQYLNERRKYGFMKSKQEGGYVIINFPGNTEAIKIIDELRHIEPMCPICFVDENIDKLPNNIALLSHVHFVKTPILQPELFTLANIEQAKSVIVYPVNNTSNADGTTKTIVDLMLQKNENVIYILVDKKNEWMFNSKATPIIKNLYILSMVQECQDKYSAPLMESILSNSYGDNISTVNPHMLHGCSWGQIVRAFPLQNIRIVLVALIRDGKVITCPDANMVIGEGDLISVVMPKLNDNYWDLCQSSIKEFACKI